jgi:carboxymethylenebutenolidase
MVAPARLFLPAGKGPWPAAVMFIDGLGIRPAMMEMAERLSGEGYVVLLPNLFYRSDRRRPMNAFSDEERAKLMAVLGKTTIGAVRKDTGLTSASAGRPEVKGSIACFGYCFGAAVP